MQKNYEALQKRDPKEANEIKSLRLNTLEGIKMNIGQVEFKTTEIGRIPKDWEMVRLREVGELQYGYTCSATKEDTGIKLLRITDINDDGKVYWKIVPYCNINESNYEKYKLALGDILFARIGATTGKTAFVDKAVKGVFASYLIKFKPIRKELDTKLIYYFTQSNPYWIQVHKNKEGQLKKGLNAKVLGNIKLPLPPFPEQKKIAEILSTVDQAIEKIDEAIKKTQRLKKGLMQELLTKGIGHKEFKDTEIGRIPKEWEVTQLIGVADINRESIDPTKKLPNSKFLYIDIDSVENGTGVISNAKEIIGKDAPSRARRLIHYNDVLMSTVRPYLKAFAIVPEQFHNQICSTGFAVLTCKGDILPDYIFCSLFTSSVMDQCNKMMVGGQYPALNTSQVEKMKIPLPSLPEQQKLAEILRTVDKRLESLRNRKEKLERIKKGLMNDLLMGRVRVKG